MKTLAIAQRSCLAVHIASLVFGLAGILFVLPHPEFIMNLSEFGQLAFQWSMAGGGAVYMVAGAAAVSLYAYRNLGMGGWLGFMLPAVLVSLAAELIGTSTGFPFGHYQYLSGLGYKVAGLVPFTIPLSWFYMGISSYLLAYRGLTVLGWWRIPAAVVTGAILLTSWDFVLDPAMSQTAMPFWAWDIPGAFFGMPYQNFAGWFGTGAVFMAMAAIFWQRSPQKLRQVPLDIPLVIYLSNFAFAMLISVHGEIYPPILLGILLGIAPAIWLYRLAKADMLNIKGLELSVSGKEDDDQESSEDFERLAVPSQGEV
ncbi:MAG: carotenoid biosynthesis protein [Cyanothece sp. SIO2G6]|nr:carotenoid biosynthesis protein [Cyanothece sp. SIO2G6]